MNFEDIYRLDVIQALEHDYQLDFKSITETYLQKGVCPKCGHRTLYISRKQPFQLACNRMNECQHTEKTRERYSYLFENLSERFPRTEANPTATADAFINAVDAGSVAGFKRIMQRLGVGYVEIEERLPDRDWDVIMLRLSDSQLSKNPDLLGVLIQQYGRTCRRYEFVTITPLPLFVAVVDFNDDQQTLVASL